MTISFKNVGQGDSIVLEWESEGKRKCGIVDCNRYNGHNPVVAHLQKSTIRELSFIFLSHPHEDHFSGLLELFEYCETNDITILRFAHTLRSDPRMLRMILDTANSISGKTNLERVLQKAKRLREAGLIRSAGNAEIDWSIELNSEWSIRNFSPSSDEMDSYIEQVEKYRNSDLTKCSKLANLLSSFLGIYSKNTGEKVLLTSDLEKAVFSRSIKRSPELLELKTVLVQIPHHGSSVNHEPNFWKLIKKEEQCPAVVSAGENKKYNHPELSVIQDFENWGFNTFATNQVNGIKEFNLSVKAKRIASILDDFSELVENDEGTDQVFSLHHIWQNDIEKAIAKKV